MDTMIEENTQTYIEEIPSQASIARHPIHPMLIPFPIAFLTGTLLSDIVFLRTRKNFWAQASLRLNVAGVITGVIAAIFGAVDFWADSRVRELRPARLHLIGNALMLGLAAINALRRVGNPTAAVRRGGVWLSALVTLLLTITGWLGGEMVFRYKVGIVPQDEPE